MKKEYLLNNKFPINIKNIIDKTDDNEATIKFIIEKAYQLSRINEEVDIEFLESIPIEAIEEAINRVEKNYNFNDFWEEIISLEYLKDNLSLLENKLFEDYDELF
ncbi:hypothetical protein U732_4 [Clostridium argentinense CDC 2741]|uniref:Uncharacterized protein n=2 Tax=Clostridium argentinense TaxID=29341 RepID=A0A0C1TZ92_9CLOT|nr:hypothetical protein [Clostridium argentinense]ARC83135.1 hypothetical protein RSJ17_00345 [Clostridium argentinense]KIE44578.1 hypothetical protein U732_4 [Clostridium argentinense CDC 2741]NFF41311.1 hypothetical protein [Clostridium argentinense]NFP51794.1 hypothetical protein [Clostridium argentinense]NFP74236.1 hypothetical protein [Clostridium argentinense]